jgi:glucosylceramidase
LAFKNPDGSIILVITNRTEADLVFTFKVEGEEKSSLYKIPPRSIQTWILK